MQQAHKQCWRGDTDSQVCDVNVVPALHQPPLCHLVVLLHPRRGQRAVHT